MHLVLCTILLLIELVFFLRMNLYPLCIVFGLWQRHLCCGMSSIVIVFGIWQRHLCCGMINIFPQVIGSPMQTTNMADFKRIAGKKGESH